MQHWYCFTYAGKNINDGRDCQACVYVGYDDTRITKPMIESNKKEAMVNDGAVLTALIYLGRMTKEEFLAV